ncbi:HAD family hydrolase [Lederbergia wuyishanensis]|uniref:Hydrolase of the HAD superfamily n=1 Tax=Lederbergia wuyishanensis TaxID=1347903 RepID=A0ABU0D072_9BACI|nr:HAD family hydrolase [Lederbergia wuyishanensis]MCJ8006432.1 HAD family hydrolase [Lederbergia wuyishanensis]MDQ0341807.1 putative hydrolase of the HAD superfamily [Lederbergia wuyishanensis]
MMVKAVFFDLYETLITEWENEKKKADFNPSRLLGMEQDIFKREWGKRKDKRMDGTFKDAKSCLVDMFCELETSFNMDDINKVIEKRIQAKAILFQSIDEKILDTIIQIKAMDIQVGLISNCAPEEVLEWENSSLANLFDTVIFSYRVKCAKPDKEIYDIACKNLNVLPEHSLFIGDGGSDELNGAAQAGLMAYHATWFQPPFINEKITGFPKLKKPSDILTILKTKG